MNARRLVLALICIPAALAFLSGSSCQERDVPVVNDEEEITAYLENSEEGRELFGATDVITQEIYTLPGDPYPRKDSVASRTRTYTFSLAADAREFSGFGIVKYGEVQVNDVLIILQTIYYGDSTITRNESRRINRSGFLLKLGSDFDPYLGWLLWGFNGHGKGTVTPLRVDARYTRQDNQSASFYGDSYDPFPPLLTNLDTLMFQGRYHELRDLPNFAPGSPLILSTEQANTSTGLRYVQLLTADRASGKRMQPMNQLDDLHAIDTIATPNPNTNLWNLVTVQCFDSTTRAFRQGWVIAYRVPQ